ncbi:hypothetical protein FRB95_005371 [Tulasnella sp. JGI-2019a]|nr:hypothetical protein FRB95_005371 [Tulasnella sp. JGI-2019a]
MIMSQTNSTAPPPPLRADASLSGLPIDDQFIKKKKSGLSLFRKRKNSHSSSIRSAARHAKEEADADALLQSAGAGPSSNPDDVYGPHLVDGEPVPKPAVPKPALDGTTQIAIEEASHDGHQTKDLYRWAVMYENQRGFTLFSIPHYGSRSLFPSDPAPFTIPSAEANARDKSNLAQSPLSLRDYQLPDARWKWVSKNWMVDMRGDGEVCSDGFEYNWAFRSNHKGWRAYPGAVSTGGWVRRRRWLRLMMRPADIRLDEEDIKVDDTTGVEVDKDGLRVDGDVHRQRTTVDAAAKTWQGDPIADWDRCHKLLRSTNRDGRRLELWMDWLGIGRAGGTTDSSFEREDYLNTIAATAKQPKDEGSQKVSTPEVIITQESTLTLTPSAMSGEDEFFTPMPMIVAAEERNWIMAVLREHGDKILSLFVFPDSRAHFIELLNTAGINSSLVIGTTHDAYDPNHIINMPQSPSLPEFWSQRNSLVYAGETEAKDSADSVVHYSRSVKGKGKEKEKLMSVSFGGKEIEVKESQASEREYLSSPASSRSDSPRGEVKGRSHYLSNGSAKANGNGAGSSKDHS